MRSTAEALREAAGRLADVSETPRLDAELLMAHAGGVARDAVLKAGREVPAVFDALIDRRRQHEPVAYITGTRDFWTITLEVNPDVLIPRPDSETLIEAAVGRFGANGPRRVIDLGTGSGALLLAALDQWPEASGVGIDASPAALKVATTNAARIAPGRAVFRQGDWATGVAERFDLVLCNPPYVEDAAELPPDVARFEPAAALFAGADGLDAYRALAPQLGAVIAPGGIACVEIGAGQADAVEALFAAHGVRAERRNDLGGHVRCLTFFPK